MTNPAIETQDLHKKYVTMRRKEIPALNGVSISVERGTVFGLLGPNGAGKTTLVKILLGLADATSGYARLLNSHPGDTAARRRIGYLPEQMRLPDYIKAPAFLRYMGRLNGVPSGTLRKRIPQLLDQVGLGGVKKPAKAYSKGMLQRLGLAQALLNDPELLILDEPTDGLDPLGRKQVRDLLLALKAAGKTIFLNSHMLSEVEQVCDRVVILHQGVVARAATPDEFTRGSGEYVVRVAEVNDAVRAAAASVASTGTWQDTSLRFTPHDRAQLNALVDKLRAVPVEIEAIEPLKNSLEQFFLKVVTGEDS
ncbi:MAG TPA: ABC transporter ATP-binding protein [Candidatus Acidoferrales bacterium]|jgi:ABC-2 type transport system ATP-binding protein|nr:ABC transporter ATP-binding protein [Candidatus Acidoferrales bacterium]